MTTLSNEGMREWKKTENQIECVSFYGFVTAPTAKAVGFPDNLKDRK